MNYEMMKGLMESRQDTDRIRAATHFSIASGQLIHAKKVNSSFAPSLALAGSILTYDLAALRPASR